MIEKIIFLDNNATTPVDKEVLSAMLPYFSELFYNPSSSHSSGKIVKKEIEKSKEKISELINCLPNEIFFTSGATESINLALKGLALSKKNNKKHIITTVSEHKAVLDTCKYLETMGYEVEYLQISSDGLIDINELENKIRPDTLLVAIMWVNNETGVIQPITEIGKITKGKETLFFCDASQAVGKIKTDVIISNIDILCFSGHKIYGPKGIGCIYINSNKLKESDFDIQIHGGGQQNGFRSGTLNAPNIIGLGKACEIATKSMVEQKEKIQNIRDNFEIEISKHEGAIIHGSKSERLYNTSNVYIPNLDTEIFIGMNKDVAVSNGSACNSALVQPSHVLTAMGLNDDTAMNSIRVSFGKYNNHDDVEYLLEKINNHISLNS